MFDHIICTYPFDEARPIYDNKNIDDITYLGLEVSKEYEKKESYKKLKELVEDIL